MSRIGPFAGALLALALAARAAAAHDQPFSYLDLRLEGRAVEGRILAHVVDLARATGSAVPDSLLDSAFAAARAETLESALARRLAIRADGVALRPAWTGIERVPGRALLAFRWRATLAARPGRLCIEGPLFTDEPQHETYLNVYEDGRLAAEQVLDAKRRVADYYSGTRQGTLAVIAEFVAQGTHHIFIGPDHILFIVGLLLLGGGLGRLLKIVTAFTVAHSVTLALAALELVRPPSRLVEPVIALSIVLVGVENLAALRAARADGARPPRDLRVPLAFGFGLVHGFGFAGVLREFGLPRHALAWSLLSFNLGVEIGQACIVLAVTPLLALARARNPARARRIIQVGSAIVIAAGTYWLVQRVFFPS